MPLAPSRVRTPSPNQATASSSFALAAKLGLDNQMPTSTTCDHAEHLSSFLQTIADKSCEKRLAGIAIGVIVDGQQFSACSGWADVKSETPVTDSTIFEVGSISKLFTSLLLAVAVKKQEVSLDDPVQAALSGAVTLPTDGEAQITYRSLANHRSSLPRLPDDLIKTADMKNPYVHYDQEMLYACLDRMESVKPIGSQGEYSNFGVGLLGHVLGKLAGSNFHQALKERVLLPLGMLDTSTESRDEQAAQLATSHRKKNKPTQHWDFTEVTVAAGGVRSSLSDMFTFLRANIDPASSELAAEIELIREPSRLPECASSKRPFLPKEFVLQLAVLIFIFSFLDAVAYLLAGRLPDLRLYAIMVLTFGSTFRWGLYAGAATLGLLTYVTSSFWGDGFDWGMTLITGASITIFGAIWKSIWREVIENRGGGDGRLAWQASKIGSHPMLWHNGMVGGAASFLGVVDEFEIGVVVLTNTAKMVDAIGVEILSELVKLKEKELEGPGSD